MKTESVLQKKKYKNKKGIFKQKIIRKIRNRNANMNVERLNKIKIWPANGI